MTFVTTRITGIPGKSCRAKGVPFFTRRRRKRLFLGHMITNIPKMDLVPPLLLARENTISDAFKAINGRFGLVVVVADRERHFCGIASEGDLRRAILAGHSLQTPLEKVMNTAPVLLHPGDLENESTLAKTIGRIYGLYSTQMQQATIPVVDNDGNIVGMITSEMLPFREHRREDGKGKKPGAPQVLVVGGAGYIGSVLVRRLLAHGWRVKVLDCMLYRQSSLEGIRDAGLSIMRGDVTSINDVVESIEGADAVVYLAEIVGDAACAYRPEKGLKTNYLSVTNMAHLCAYVNINRFIYTSSCSVYGGSKSPDHCLSEESELNPVSHYGRMKILSEQALLGMDGSLFAPTILRLATAFGSSYRPRFDLVVNAFAKNAYFKRRIEVFGGNQWRPNVHVGDVARAIIDVLESPLEKVSRQIFNVGSNRENYTIDQISDLVSSVFPDTAVTRKSESVDPRNYKVDFSKMERALGYGARMTVRDGLQELKSVFERGEIENPDDLRYSNIEALKEYDGGTGRK